MAVTIKTSANGTGMEYGVSDITIAGVSIESADIDITAQIDATATDQEGLVAAWAFGGKQGTVSVSGFLKGTVADIGTDFTVSIGGETATVGITGVKRSKGNRDFGKVVITGKFYEGVA